MNARVLLVLGFLATPGTASAELLFRATAGDQVVYVLCSVKKPVGEVWRPSVELEQAYRASGLLLTQVQPATTSAAEKKRISAAAAAIAGIQLDDSPQEVLVARAEADGKRVHGMQTLEEDNAPFEAMSAEAKARKAELSALRKRNPAEVFATRWKLWQTGDVAGFEAEARAQMAEYEEADPGLPGRFFAQRKNWLRIVSRHAAESPIVIIGALDMFGDRGLLAGLEVAGFAVEQVKVNHAAPR